jgi:lysozyme family protein
VEAILRSGPLNKNFTDSFNALMVSEGGFVNDPRDPGGATNHGVTKAVWEEWIGESVTVDDMKALTVDDVKPLYKKKYWDSVCGDELPSGVDYCVFDYAVNSGVVRSARALQTVLHVDADGQIGPITLAKASQQNPVHVIEDISNARIKFLQGLSTWDAFGKGWTKRVEQVEDMAKNMASV